MTRSLIALLSAAAIAFAIAACGGSSSSSSGGASSSSTGGASSSSSGGTSSSVTTSSAAPGAVAHATALTIAADPTGKLMFTKTSLSAKAGEVTIQFTNKSPLGHNFTLQKSIGNDAVVAATPTFHGGTRTLKLKLAAGTYTFYCSVPGHRQAGMQGTLTVT